MLQGRIPLLQKTFRQRSFCTGSKKSFSITQQNINCDVIIKHDVPDVMHLFDSNSQYKIETVIYTLCQEYVRVLYIYVLSLRSLALKIHLFKYSLRKITQKNPINPHPLQTGQNVWIRTCTCKLSSFTRSRVHNYLLHKQDSILFSCR